MSEAGYGVVPIEQARTMDGLTLFKAVKEGRSVATNGPLLEFYIRQFPELDPMPV